MQSDEGETRCADSVSRSCWSRSRFPVPVHAQGSVTLTVCNTGAVDIDVLVSPAGSAFSSHIAPRRARLSPRAKAATEQAYLGLAFTDSRGQWGAARRFDDVPYMGVRELPLATRVAMTFSGEKVPPAPRVLTMAEGSHTIQRGNVSVPLQLLFQPGYPECRNVATGGGATLGNTTIIERTTVCEDLGYTLTVEAYPDSREINLGALGVGGFFSDGPLGTTIVHDQVEMNWAEATEERKVREAPQPINWTDLLSSYKRWLQP